MTMSLEALALSANSWQLTTLNPYPSHVQPLISIVFTLICSCPVFSTLNVLLSVKFGSLYFISRNKQQKVVSVTLNTYPSLYSYSTAEGSSVSTTAEKRTREAHGNLYSTCRNRSLKPDSHHCQGRALVQFQSTRTHQGKTTNPQTSNSTAASQKVI